MRNAERLRQALSEHLDQPVVLLREYPERGLATYLFQRLSERTYEIMPALDALAKLGAAELSGNALMRCGIRAQDGGPQCPSPST